MVDTASSFVSEARNLLYDYTSDTPAPAVLPGLWTRSYFYPFVSVFSPFSYSVLAEISRRAWFHYYSRLGHDIGFAPKSLVRSVDGRPYLDLKWLCEQDVAFAGLPPLALHLNQKPVTVCPWEKPGLVAGFKFGRNQKKIDDLLNGLSQDMGKITERIRGWHKKVQAMRWTQAEILQIMEEIERFGIDSLLAYFAARHNLERSYNGLLAMLPGGMTAQNLSLINNSLSDLDGLLEVDLTTRILALAKLAAADSKLMAWLGGSPGADWSATLPAGPLAEGVRELLASFGQWTTGLGGRAGVAVGGYPHLCQRAGDCPQTRPIYCRPSAVAGCGGSQFSQAGRTVARNIAPSDGSAKPGAECLWLSAGWQPNLGQGSRPRSRL
jgi:hypothetical protein